MRKSKFSAVVMTFIASMVFCTSSAEIYEYKNAVGRTIRTTTPPPGHGETAPDAPSRSFKFIKSKQRTAEDIPLDFEVDKTEYSNGYLRIWGNIKGSKKNQSYTFVKVTFSLYGGRGGDLLAREYTYANPKDIGPGEIGYIIEYLIKCDISKLNVIEYKVTGK